MASLFERLLARLPRPVRTLVAAGEYWARDDAFSHSAAVSFYTLFSLAPVMIIALGIAGFFLGQEAATGQLAGQLTQLVGKESAEFIQKTVETSTPRKEGWGATIVGVVVLLVAATTVFGEMQQSLNAIWGVTSKPSRSGWAVMLIQRLISFAMVLTIGFVLLVSLVLTTAVTALIKSTEGYLTVAPLVMRVSDTVLGLGVITLLFALLFKILPDVILRWRDVWRGAFATALLFVVGRYLIALYLGYSSVASSYGAAGSLVALLIWVYYSCAILFFGVEYSKACREAEGLKVYPKKTAVLIRKEIVEDSISRSRHGRKIEHPKVEKAAEHGEEEVNRDSKS